MSNQSDTPETDNVWNRFAAMDHPEFEKALCDHARKLERERDEARREAEAYRDITQNSKWPKHRYPWETV